MDELIDKMTALRWQEARAYSVPRHTGNTECEGLALRCKDATPELGSGWLHSVRTRVGTPEAACEPGGRSEAQTGSPKPAG